jgi:hypothetical protein
MTRSTRTQRDAKLEDSTLSLAKDEPRKKTKRTEEQSSEVDIIQISRGVVEVCVIGRSPLICNRMSEKAKRTLLFPPPKMNAADRETNLKHDPLQEFRDSPYTNINDGPTRLQALGTWFKKGAMSAALDLPTMKKAQIGRRIYVQQDRIDLYGIPQIMLATVRNSDIKGSPDIRSRAILPRWACKLSIIFSVPLVRQGEVLKLFGAAGIIAGAGDWRVEKGSGSYGQYELVNSDDPEFLSILKEGRVEQDEALASPTAYDDETYSLLDWFNRELTKRNRRKEVSIAAD